jgi:NitT/TauT family transport system substrate-binding protein
MLAASDADWQRLAPRIGTTDGATLAIYRQHYAEGIPRRPIAEESGDARTLYRVLADIGGADLVGSAKELDAGTFYRLPPGN